MLYFELAERIRHKDSAKDSQEEKEEKISTDTTWISRLLTQGKKAMVLNFLLSSVLFLLLWSKQVQNIIFKWSGFTLNIVMKVILFMDLINIPYLVPGSTFLTLTPDTVARSLDTWR